MNEAASLAAVNPGTGEVLEHLEQQPPETLCEALDAIHARQTEVKRWEAAIETELRRRLKVRQSKLAQFGDWEVQVASGRESEWDAEALEQAMAQLAAQGVVPAGEMTGVIVRDPVVQRSKAKQLVGRLTGDAREIVQACCTWKDKQGKLTVTRSVELLPGGPTAELPAAEETPSHPDPPDAVPPDAPAPAGSPRRPAPPVPLDPEELFA